MGFDSKHEFAPPTILLGLLLCPWMWGISSQLLQCLLSYWGFSDLGCGYLHIASLVKCTLDMGYLFTAAPVPCSPCTNAAKSLQSCLTLRPHRRQPTRPLCPWDSPGKNTGVGCHFLLNKENIYFTVVYRKHVLWHTLQTDYQEQNPLELSLKLHVGRYLGIPIEL